MTLPALAADKPGRAPAVPAGSVSQWGVFEASVPNSKQYKDPYANVRLEVTYTRPDQSVIRFWGFYDGGTTWKIRFMPDKTGSWRYDAMFSDGTKGASGSFNVVADKNRLGLIGAYEPNPIWFAHKGDNGGTPVLIRSFHAGSNFFSYEYDDPANGNDGNKRTAFLNWLQQEGYNTISAGQLFIGKKERSEQFKPANRLWPLNAREYQKAEVILDDLAKRRMIVYPFYGFFGKGTGFPTSQADQKRYIEYMVARFGPYSNLLFNVAGPEPNLKKYLSEEEVKRLGAMIAEADVFGHLLGVHNKDGDDPYRKEAWNSLTTLQDEVTDLGELNQYFLKNHTGNPVYAQETLWPGNILQPFKDASMATIRQHAWVHMLSAVSLNYGDQKGNNSSGFSGSLDVADAIAERHAVPKKIWDFMETVPFYRMKPCPEAAPEGTFCLGEAGQHYLIYFPRKKSATFNLPPKMYSGRWINGADPTKSVQLAKPLDAKNQKATPPKDGEDWLLELKGS